MKIPLTFSRTNADFSSTLNKRVNAYFNSNGIARTGNSEMFAKSAVMFLLYLIPYFLIVFQTFTNPIHLLALAIVMSFGLGGIGLSVMHDANHGAYSKHAWINKTLGYSLNFVGANAFNWKMQHNVLHHTYTNVHGEDEDIISRGVLRLTPYSNWRSVYRFQHIYAWFLYGLMTISWMFVKDFARLSKYNNSGLVKKHKASVVREAVILIGSKLIYFGYIFIIPLAFTPLLWWQILIGVLTMHFIAGFMLSIIFQPAHIIDGTQYPHPNEEHMLENNWAVHQLVTTTNFGNRNKWFSWYIGGLNFQIEHHLFPNVCHVHYRNLAPIVKATAMEFQLPYHSATSFWNALEGHAKLLRQLGRRPIQNELLHQAT